MGEVKLVNDTARATYLQHKIAKKLANKWYFGTLMNFGILMIVLAQYWTLRNLLSGQKFKFANFVRKFICAILGSQKR